MLWFKHSGLFALALCGIATANRGGHKYSTKTTERTICSTTQVRSTPRHTSTSHSNSKPGCTRQCVCDTRTATSETPTVTYTPIFETSPGLGGEIIPESLSETYTSIQWSTVEAPDLSEPAAPPDLGATLNSDDNTANDADTNAAKRAADNPPLPVEKRQLPSAVDWRQRWGWNFLHSPQNQGGCQSCWAFAAVALVETQARIEHGAWSKRSEADLHDMLGASCATTGGPAGALDWAIDNARGIADPHCYPYTGTDQMYYPCGDRVGRALRLPAYTRVGSVDDQKRWLNNVGPLAACFNVYPDFYRFNFSSTTAYEWDNQGNPVGGHCVLIVGYDDTAGGWIFRNSWGAGFGDRGYGYIAYGTARIDARAKIGISNVNPDPWSKKRHHNGILLESGNGGGHRNFEVMRANASGGLTHVWRQGALLRRWRVAGPVVQLDGSGNPVASQFSFGQPVLLSTSFNRDFEVLFVNTRGNIVSWHYAQSRDRWYRHAEVDVSGFTLEGYPGFAQMDDASYSLVVRTSTGGLQEWTRSALTGHWLLSTPVSPADTILSSGPSLVQSNVNLDIYSRARTSGGNLYTVAVLTTGQMQLFYRATTGPNGCTVNKTWIPTEVFGLGNIRNATPPVMIQDYWRTESEREPGGFQLLVAVGGRVEHWQRVNTDILERPPVLGGSGRWGRVRVFGGGEVRHVWGLLQGSWRGALDAIVEDWNGNMWHWRFAGNPGQWSRVAAVPGVRGG